jgi:hypothetical protein
MRFFGPGKSQVLLIEWIHTLKSLDFIIELLHILNGRRYEMGFQSLPYPYPTRPIQLKGLSMPLLFFAISSSRAYNSFFTNLLFEGGISGTSSSEKLLPKSFS